VIGGPASGQFVYYDRTRTKATGNTLTRIVRGASLGRFAEALYNRFGLFPNARVLSIYAQIKVPDAYRFRSGDAQLSARTDVIHGTYQCCYC
jgi:hypothetical protein